jgi:hypothetical protein
MSRGVYFLLSAINIALFLAGLYFIMTRGVAFGQGWSAVELVTVMLTALGVMVAVLTLFVAILAVWGFTRLSEEAKDKAEHVTQDYLDKALPGMIEREVERRIGAGPDYGAGAAKGE